VSIRFSGTCTGFLSSKFVFARFCVFRQIKCIFYNLLLHINPSPNNHVHLTDYTTYTQLHRTIKLQSRRMLGKWPTGVSQSINSISLYNQPIRSYVAKFNTSYDYCFADPCFTAHSKIYHGNRVDQPFSELFLRLNHLDFKQ